MWVPVRVHDPSYDQEDQSEGNQHSHGRSHASLLLVVLLFVIVVAVVGVSRGSRDTLRVQCPDDAWLGYHFRTGALRFPRHLRLITTLQQPIVTLAICACRTAVQRGTPSALRKETFFSLLRDLHRRLDKCQFILYGKRCGRRQQANVR